MRRRKILDERRLDDAHCINKLRRNLRLNFAAQENPRLEISQIFVRCQQIIVKHRWCANRGDGEHNDRHSNADPSGQNSVFDRSIFYQQL